MFYVILGLILIPVFAILAAFLSIVRIAFAKNKYGPSPFETDHRRPRPPGPPADFTKRSAVLKVPYSTKLDLDKTEWDSIVIGTGIGGLSTAWCLAKSGQRVLMLEQHDMAGGCCHTFKDKGYEFDVGIHYIGEMDNLARDRYIMDQITAGQVEWALIDQNYDTVVVGKDQYPWTTNRNANVTMLCKSFPSIPQSTFEQYFTDMHKSGKAVEKFYLLKFMPLWSIKVLRTFGLLSKLVGDTSLFTVTTYDYLAKLIPSTTPEAMRAKLVLSYIWGDIGSEPKEASQALVSLIQAYFEKGGYYPVGGAGQIAYAIVPQVEAAGGKVVCKAMVDDIVVEGGKAVGVRVKGTVIRGKNIISAAGFTNTYAMLKKPLPPSLNGNVRDGLASFCVFIGLDKSAQELKLPARNYWIFSEDIKFEDPLADIRKLGGSFWDDPSNSDKLDYPMVFLSFPSAKDPAWDHDGATIELVSFAPYEWFSEWKDEKCGSRTDAYNQRKMNLAASMWRTACKVMPQLNDAERLYFSAATALTNLHYINGSKGAIYGLDHNVKRFEVDTFAALRAETEVPNLYISGQDVSTAGFAGALTGGLVCASAVLGENQFLKIDKAWRKDRRAKRQASGEKKKN